MSLSTDTFYTVYARKRDKRDGSDLPYALSILESARMRIAAKMNEIPASMPSDIKERKYGPLTSLYLDILNMIGILDHRVATDTPLLPHERAGLDMIMQSSLPRIQILYGVGVTGGRRRRRHSRKTRKHSRR